MLPQATRATSLRAYVMYPETGFKRSTRKDLLYAAVMHVLTCLDMQA